MRDLIAVSLDVVDISFSFVHHFSASAGRNLLMCWLEQPGCLIIQLITHETPVTQPCHAATSNTNCSGTWHYTYYLIPNKYAVLNMYAKVQLCYSFLPSQMHFTFLFSALCHRLTLAHTVIHKDRQCNSPDKKSKVTNLKSLRLWGLLNLLVFACPCFFLYFFILGITWPYVAFLSLTWLCLTGP